MFEKHKHFISVCLAGSNLCIQINVYHYRYFLQTLPPVLLHVRPQKRRTHCLLHLQNPFLPMCRTKNVLTSLLLFSSVSWDRKQHLQFRALSAKEAQELLPPFYRIPYFTDIKPRPRHNNNTARRTGGLCLCLNAKCVFRYTLITPFITVR